MIPLTRQTIEEIRALREKKYRYEKMLFWAEGERTVLSLLEGGLQVSSLVMREDYPVPDTLLQHPLLICRNKDENKIKATQTFPGIAGVFKIPGPSPLKNPVLIAVDKISDPGNLGAIFRAAVWFGFYDFILDEETVDPYHEKVVRASMGSLSKINCLRTPDLAKTLLEYQEKGYTLAATDLKGNSLKEKLPSPLILILGNEAHGVSQKVLDVCSLKIRIPGSGIESLNVSVAAGILLYEIACIRNTGAGRTIGG